MQEQSLGVLDALPGGVQAQIKESPAVFVGVPKQEDLCHIPLPGKLSDELHNRAKSSL